MAALGDNSPDSPDADPQGVGPAAPGEHPPDQVTAPASAPEVSIGKRLGQLLLVMGGIAAAVLIAVGTGALTLPGADDSTHSTQTTAQAALAAKRTAANERWASATCTDILRWKNQLGRDGGSLNLGLGSLTRIQNTIAATTRMLNELSKLGLPPATQTAQARAETDQLRSDIMSRLHNIEGAVGSVASGNLAAIGTLLSDLQNGKAVGTQIVNELRHVLSVDLGLSLVDSPACRQLVGISV